MTATTQGQNFTQSTWSKSLLDFGKLNDNLAGWQSFLLQACLLVPVAVLPLWAGLWFLLNLILPTSGSDYAAKACGAFAVLAVGLSVGVLVGRLIPSARPAGRCIIVLVALLALGLAPRFHEYAIDHPSASKVSVVLDWLFDDSLYWPYAYFSYWVGILLSGIKSAANPTAV